MNLLKILDHVNVARQVGRNADLDGGAGRLDDALDIHGGGDGLAFDGDLYGALDCDLCKLAVPDGHGDGRILEFDLGVRRALGETACIAGENLVDRAVESRTIVSNGEVGAGLLDVLDVAKRQNICVTYAEAVNLKMWQK